LYKKASKHLLSYVSGIGEKLAENIVTYRSENVPFEETPEIGILGIKDILKELEKPGLNPRKSAKIFEFDPNVKTIKDVKTGILYLNL
jgi:transcriptional accessory protein Tex/SPT6